MVHQLLIPNTVNMNSAIGADSEVPLFSEKAAAAGYDSIQFLHSEPSAPCSHLTGVNMNYELVSTKLIGAHACGSPDGDSTLIRSGWKGAKKCTCDNTLGHINCQEVSGLYSLPVRSAWKSCMP